MVTKRAFRIAEVSDAIQGVGNYRARPRARDGILRYDVLPSVARTACVHPVLVTFRGVWLYTRPARSPRRARSAANPARAAQVPVSGH